MSLFVNFYQFRNIKMNKPIRPLYRLLALAIGSMVLAIFAPKVVQAAAPVTLESLDATTKQLQISIDTTWVLLTGFLIFFMQTGFSMLEAGLLRQRGVVNALLEFGGVWDLALPLVQVLVDLLVQTLFS
jgi:hypothetical protein